MTRYLNGSLEKHHPSLVIAFENGYVQFMRDEKDVNPICIDSQMRKIKLAWNRDGTILALSGILVATSKSGQVKDVSVIQFYNPKGIVYNLTLTYH